MSAGYFPKREKVGLEDLFRGLVTAGHILHREEVTGEYGGHVSVRSPDNPATYWMSCALSPALVSSADDLVEYNVEDSSPVEKDAKTGFLERFIHGEIYKKFPAINCVVHGHTSEVLPYCVTDVPLKATTHLAGFLGGNIPVWDASAHAPSGSKQHLLVTDAKLGASLAAAFKPATSAGFIYSKVRSALPAQLAGNPPDPSREPDHAVVLMRGHGFTTVATGIEEAVYQSVYLKRAAKTQTAALTIHNAYFGHTVEGKVDVEGGGKIKSAKVKPEGSLKYLTDKEAHDAWEANQPIVGKSWALWCREVEVSPFYRNECPGSED
ncbi:arad-like aldolase/epimerase [Sporormia fimetaria CBS 119925]|uniref:Arad-like aldolase/epimerase n=1 Tax=Sporormia fimetaria CBS 119925 TaxID=1340428 RepID=A0A6A6VSE0_9PLEO|nr:arad-like aldolase/epimerase [Sporormia fimetaria CBS 119925]